VKNVLIAALLLLPTPVLAAKAPVPQTLQPSPDPNPDDPKLTYDYCIQLTKLKPEQAVELAGKWIAIGGGDAAHHCQALAMIGMQNYGEGASRLEELAQKSKQEPQMRAAMLEQAGQAWMLQGEPQRAYEADTAGLKLAMPGSSEQVILLVDRSAALAEGAQYKEAIADLDAALKISPDNGDALAFRASAHRHLGELDLAFADADQAVKKNAKNITALLERGLIYRAQNHLAEARRDFDQVSQLAPDSEEAKTARENMAELDVKPDAAK
jgi:tetratricopeptide (TPR) repeat protein